jgi:uncharacterized membrane protein
LSAGSAFAVALPELFARQGKGGQTSPAENHRILRRSEGFGDMKSIVGFLKTTLLGGVIFLMPVVTLALVMGKALQMAEKFVKPVEAHVPDNWDFGMGKATLLAVGLTVLVCFVAGLLAKTKYANWLVKGLETSVLSKIPAYEYFKQLGTSVLGVDALQQRPVVLVQVESGWQIGIEVEDLKNGFVAVFVPDAPDPHSGALLFVDRQKAMPVGASIAATLGCLKRYGAGSTALFQKIPAGEKAP